MQKLFIHHNFNVEYIDEGVGNIVILIHGFGEDNTIWQHQIDFLKEHYRVIAPNISGIGKSSFIQKEIISIEDYADVIYEFLVSLNISTNQQISMFGHSMGGYITLAFLKKYSNLLHSFGLIHSTAFADSDEKKQIRLRAIDTMKAYGIPQFIRNTIPNLFSNISKEKYKVDIENLIQHASKLSLQTLQQFYIAMMHRKDTTDVLQQTSSPILFVIGEEDNAAPIKDVLQQVHLPKISAIKVIKNIAHMGMIEATNTVNASILSFLKTFDY